MVKLHQGSPEPIRPSSISCQLPISPVSWKRGSHEPKAVTRRISLPVLLWSSPELRTNSLFSPHPAFGSRTYRIGIATRQSAQAQNVTWSVWNSRERLGEAQNPGLVDLLRIISGNVTALQPHIKGKLTALKRWIEELKPSALALQEVRLSTEAQAFCSPRLPAIGLNTVLLEHLSPTKRGWETHQNLCVMPLLAVL